MQDYSKLTFAEANKGVSETLAALKRTEGHLENIRAAMVKRPKTFAPLAEATFRLRDRLLEDLKALEAALREVD